MESAGTDRAVRGKKREIRCPACGSRAGKSGKDGAELFCPKCRANIEVDFDGLTLITKTQLKEI